MRFQRLDPHKIALTEKIGTFPETPIGRVDISLTMSGRLVFRVEKDEERYALDPEEMLTGLIQAAYPEHAHELSRVDTGVVGIGDRGDTATSEGIAATPSP